MSFFGLAARRGALPAVAGVLYGTSWSFCSAENIAPLSEKEIREKESSPTTKEKRPPSAEEESFHGMFPKRQLWQPKLPYPLWDMDWDGRMPPSTGNKDQDRRRLRELRSKGVTRHVILVRHGQYDETQRDDDKRLLTDLGRQQAHLTGKRIAEMIAGVDEKFGPCNVKVIRVSNMFRARETADIIALHIPGVTRAEPDPLLSEGRPAHNIPGGRASPGTIERTDEAHPRIEKAFRKYFYRATMEESTENRTNSAPDQNPAQANNIPEGPPPNPSHEFEIIVCHANVIRYFFCRALQLPPEAWLRLCTFNCSLTYLTIRPSGTVSCRSLGDIGHLPYGLSTFSMHHGFNW